MANNYLQFSEVLTHLTEEEEKWLKDQLEFVYVFGDKEYIEDELPKDLDADAADWAGCRAYRDMKDYESDPCENAGFEGLFDTDKMWKRHLWLYAEENADIDRAVHLVQKFLHESSDLGTLRCHMLVRR